MLPLAMAPRVLVCDNEEALRSLVRAALDDGTYEILEARDGDESLELARRVRPDLILLDMMMPGRTGLEILAELRRDEGFANTPVVMLTARTLASDRQAAADLGADRFVSKPFSPRELVSTVDELLRARV